MGAFKLLSRLLRERPLITNMGVSTSVGFLGDVICQTVYEPSTQLRPPLKRSQLPPESAASPLLFEVTSPALYVNQWWRGRSGGAAAAAAQGAAADTEVILDLRRSFIFCSFTCFFGVPYFLQVYRVLDRYISPLTITKKQALVKGFLSYVAAQLSNPIFITYLTSVGHYVIFRDGRDGRRRIPDGTGARSADHHNTATGKAAILYRFVEDKSFDAPEFFLCVSKDVVHKLTHDFPDIARYGFLFWGCNWLPLFYYIPPHFRLCYGACLQVVWSGIMSHLMHRNHGPGLEDTRLMESPPSFLVATNNC